VKRQQDEWNWEFIYLSSEPDSVAEAIRMGVPQANTVVLGKSGAQYGMATAAVSSTVSNFRSSGKVYVEDNDLRDKA
jgi:hypothetical protein